MPISMMSPIIDGIDKRRLGDEEREERSGIDSTSATRIVAGCTKSLNSSTSTM